MKADIEPLIHRALKTLVDEGVLPSADPAAIQVSRSKDPAHGDFACNIALVQAKAAGMPPRQLAERIVAALPADRAVVKTEIAGPGFINFFLSQAVATDIVGTIVEQGEAYGRSRAGAGRRVLVEFVSANPTGPLHVGHGRGAAYGQALSNLLAAAGFEVEREYYVNDAGRQMDILAVSVWVRYLQRAGLALAFPANGYRGEYVADIAAALHAELGERLVRPLDDITGGLPADADDGGDREAYIDALTERCKTLLGGDYRPLFEAGLNTILQDIRQDLSEFGVEFENWFRESRLTEGGDVERCLERLRASNYVYRENGALWFKSTAFGDEKDRVVLRDNGEPTYFASDIAYHLNKLNRGYDRLIDIWGADHHGYVPRVRASLKALNGSDDKLDVLLVQFAILYRGREKVPMSTRAGSFVTLRELRTEVGVDAARFFYIMRRSEQHMDFDLELAKSQSNDNPVYYVQYAHARIASVFKQLADQNLDYDRAAGLEHLPRLTETHETELIKTLSRYPEVIEHAALNEEPHQLTYFLREVANQFHSYYNAHTFLVEDRALRNARLVLIEATRQVLRNALRVIDVSAPETM